MKIVKIIATYFSLAYPFLIFLSYVFSKYVPSFEMVRDARSTNCYWSNAMVPYVECGVDFAASGILKFFYNFWMMFIYLPAFGLYSAAHSITYFVAFIALTVLIYAPLIFLVYLLMKKLGSKTSSNN